MVNLLAMVFPPQKEIFKCINAIVERLLLIDQGLVAALKMAYILGGFGKDCSLGWC